MEKKRNIIAIRRRNITEAHAAFVDLMDKTERILNNDAALDPDSFKRFSTTDLEFCALERIKAACSGTPFREEEVKLISGQRFPDIVAEKYYGIEVKSTKSDSWTSTGSSIVESTRDINVDDFYMLFGKMGGNIPEFKCRPYEDVLYDIAVTHSPRYLINMELTSEKTIFAKMSTTYNDFRTSDNSIALVRRYYREKAKKANKQEMPWWITNENAEQPQYFNIKLWNALTVEEKRALKAKCMILFPEALNPKRSMTKYNNTTLWLCSYNQVVNPNIRDLYSAGGEITHVNGVKLQKPVAQVFNQIVEYSQSIKHMLYNPTTDLLMLIEEYNPYLLKGNDLFKNWLSICQEYAPAYGIQISDWIDSKPTFTFSKKGKG